MLFTIKFGGTMGYPIFRQTQVIPSWYSKWWNIMGCFFSSAFIYGLCKTLPTCRVDVQSWQDLDGNCTQIVWILQHPNITFESDHRMDAWFTIGEAIGCDSCIFSGLPLKRTQGWLPFSYNKRKAEGIGNLLIGRKIRLGCRPIYYCIFRPEIWLDLTILVARLHQHVAWPGYMQNPTSITVKPESQTAGELGSSKPNDGSPQKVWDGIGWGSCFQNCQTSPGPQVLLISQLWLSRDRPICHGLETSVAPNLWIHSEHAEHLGLDVSETAQ